MLSRRILLIGAVGLILTTGSVRGETALEIVSACRGVASAPIQGNQVWFTRDYPSGLCWGAFAAIQELYTVQLPDGTAMLGACPPVPSNRVELIKVFLKYTDDHPETLHESFAYVFLPALFQAYPCSKP
jgi:hypothetical protein